MPGCLAPESSLSCQLQHTLHGVQPSRVEVEDVAFHSYGLEPLRDASVRDPIRATEAGQAEGHPVGFDATFVPLEYRSWLAGLGHHIVASTESEACIELI